MWQPSREQQQQVVVDGESFTVEFKDVDLKAAVGDTHSGIGVYLTAFLNSGHGGTIYYGVHDDGFVRGLRLAQRDWVISIVTITICHTSQHTRIQH